MSRSKGLNRNVYPHRNLLRLARLLGFLKFKFKLLLPKGQVCERL